MMAPLGGAGLEGEMKSKRAGGMTVSSASFPRPLFLEFGF